jgi:hypothetical protein
VNADTIILTITIRPSYADAGYVRGEVEQSLELVTVEGQEVRIASSARFPV